MAPCKCVRKILLGKWLPPTRRFLRTPLLVGGIDFLILQFTVQSIIRTFMQKLFPEEYGTRYMNNKCRMCGQYVHDICTIFVQYVYMEHVTLSLANKYVQLFIEDPFSQSAGEALRDGFLRHGNGLKPSQMYLNCTGERLDPEIIINQLLSEFKLANKDNYLL